MRAITLGVLGVLLAGVLGLFSFVGSVKREGIEQETQMAAQYTANQNALSAYVTSIKEQVGVANLKSNRLDAVLSDAVSGRYGADGFSANGAFFSAVKEAYPDLTQLNIYDRLIDAIQAGRTEFKNKQDALADRVRLYDNWRNDGILQPIFVKMYFPSDVLQVRKGHGFVTGAEALQLIRTQVLDRTTTKAFETGEMEPLQLDSGVASPNRNR